MVSGWNIIMRGPLHLVSTPPPPPWLGSSEGHFVLLLFLRIFLRGMIHFFSGSIVNLQHPLLGGRGAVAIKWINSQ